METPVKVEERNGLTIEVHQDDDAMSPDEIGDVGLFLVANHRDFYVKCPKNSTVESVRHDYEDSHWIFGLEAYIHSGVVLALAGEGLFPDRQWDVSQLGMVFVSKQEWKSEEKAREAAKSLIEEWNNYLSGNVWGFVILDRDEEIDSCWGYYGDIEYCLAEARARVDSLTHDGTTNRHGQLLMTDVLDQTDTAGQPSKKENAKRNEK